MTIDDFDFQLVDELARKKADYTKHLEIYRSMRSRFEEHFFKSKSYILRVYTYLKFEVRDYPKLTTNFWCI